MEHSLLFGRVLGVTGKYESGRQESFLSVKHGRGESENFGKCLSG